MPKQPKPSLDLDKNQRRIYKIGKKKRRFGMFLGAGSGKTRIVLQILFARMKKDKKMNALIVSTKANVLETWPNELREQMQHTGVKFSSHVWHNEYQQIVIGGVNCPHSARIHICSYEHLRRLLWHYDNSYFDFLIVDESVRMKNWKAKATSIILAFSEQVKHVYALSGLPAPNKIEDLYAQVFMLDGGERLGTNLTAFRRQYMDQAHYSRFVWNLKGKTKTERKQTEQQILDKIKDICVTEQTEAFVPDLVDVAYHVVKYELPTKQLKRYRKFARKAILEIEDAENVTAANGAVLRGKLLQYSSGNIYEDLDPAIPKRATRVVNRLSGRRRKAFEHWLNEHYKKGSKLIVSYAFRHSIDDIMRALHRHVKPRKIFLAGGGQSTRTLTLDWNAKRIDVVVTFAGSIGHGLNLQQHGGAIFFYGITDNYDHYYQLVARIRRRGNPHDVCHVHTLACEGTADELVVQNIVSKASLGQRVMSASTLISKHRRALG